MTINIILHILVSEVLLVVLGLEYSQCWSPLALLIIGLITFTLVFAISLLYVFPFRSSMPVMAGSVRVICYQLELPMPAGGIKWGDISTPERRIAGFGENLSKWVTLRGSSRG